LLVTPDTFFACDTAVFKVNHKVQSAPSPNYSNVWSVGTSNSSGSTFGVNTSGTLILTTTSEDGCYIDKDTIIVTIGQTPDPASIN
jgi:hypothetical protein